MPHRAREAHPTADPADDGTLDRPLEGVVGAGTPEDPRLIVEIWIAVRQEDGWRLLMCRRTAERGGFWQGVSGRVEPTDPTLRSAALREIREELGLAEVETLFDMGRWYDFRSILSGNKYRKRVIGAVLPAGTTPRHVTLCHEHDRCRLMTFAEARAVARFPEYVTELDAFERRLP